jgi:ABC-type amino acid transport substrate-binding protein
MRFPRPHPPSLSLWLSLLLSSPLLLLLLLLLLSAAAPARANDWSDIRARNELRIGTSGTAVPNSWVNKRNELTGFDIDWGNLIGKELGIPVRWVKIDFRGLFPALAYGQIDLIITGVRIRDDLQRQFLFSRPYSWEESVGVVRPDDTATRGFGEFRGKTVAVVAASYQEDLLKKIGGYEEMLVLPSGADVFLAMHTGHADIVLTGITAATHYRDAGHPVRILGSGKLSPQGIVMNRHSARLKAMVDAIVARYHADGTYARLYQKHFGMAPPSLEKGKQ